MIVGDRHRIFANGIQTGVDATNVISCNFTSAALFCGLSDVLPGNLTRCIVNAPPFMWVAEPFSISPRGNFSLMNNRMPRVAHVTFTFQYNSITVEPHLIACKLEGGHVTVFTSYKSASGQEAPVFFECQNVYNATQQNNSAHSVFTSDNGQEMMYLSLPLSMRNNLALANFKSDHIITKFIAVYG